MSKIIGIPVGTPISPETIKEKLKPVLSVNGVKPNVDGNAEVMLDFKDLTDEQKESLKGKDGKDGKDGVDGYTPIKGVDYFDGKDGVNGIDGKDGKDGYTPIKGIDYFDGTNGRDGIDGKDGINGKDGYTPIKGTDYFTDADVQEIVDKVAEEMPTPITSWNDLTDKPDFAPIATSGSWNDLTDKPFGEMPPVFDITWDGDMTGHEVFDYGDGAYDVKVSDEVFTKEQLLNSTTFYSSGYEEINTEEIISVDEEMGAIFLNGYIVIFSAENFNSVAGLPEGTYSNGIWFFNWTGEDPYYTNRLVASSIFKILDNKYLDLGGYAKTEDLPAVAKSGSYNDLIDKPFGSEFEYTEVASAAGVVDTYSTDTLRASFQPTLDFVPINGKYYKLVATDGVQTIEAVQVCTIMDIPAMNYYSVNIGIALHTNSSIMIQGSKGGVWGVAFLATTEVGAEWTITVYEHTEIVTPLNSKYLPDGIPFVASASVGQGIAVKAVDGNKPIEFEAVNLVKSYKDLTDAPVGERITTIMDEYSLMIAMGTSSYIGSYNLTGCNLVCFDGVEYEVSLTFSGMEHLYGNPALRTAGLPSNGMPFVLANNQMTNSVTLYVSEPGTYTISAHKRELVFLSEKFLPDSVVLESELEGKGYQTEEQVKTLIDEVGGATSWNDLEDRPFGDTFDFTEVASVTLTVDNYDEVKTQCSCSGFLNFAATHGREYKLEATDGIQTITGRGTCKITDIPTASIYGINIISDDGLIGMYTQSKVTSALWEVYFKAKSEVGTEWIIRIYEAVETIMALDEKYLPETVVLESELEAKGYQTEEQVTALINNAIANLPRYNGEVEEI